MDRNRKRSCQTKEVALVTGSRRGIGLGIAMGLARGGFHVVLNGTSSPRKAEHVMKRIRSHGAVVEYVQADVSLKADREKLIRTIQDVFGRLDVLVNNAGVAPEDRVDILEAKEESFDRVININLKGPYFLTQQIAKWMIAQKRQDVNRGPKIINISSISAYAASPSRGEYCVSKAGISMMTTLFALRLAEYGIGVYEIRPGIIETDMTKPVKQKYDQRIADGLTPMKRWGTPEDLGRVALAVARGDLPFSTGEIINVDGGFHLRAL